MARHEFLAAMRGSLSLERQPSLVSVRPNMMMTKSESLYNTVEEEEWVRSNVPVSMRRNRGGETSNLGLAVCESRSKLLPEEAKTLALEEASEAIAI